MTIGRGHELTPKPGNASRRRRPGQVLACGWCGKPIEVAATGRLPKWCSSTCRHRAWEAAQAAAAGVTRVVEVVDRQVEIEVVRQSLPEHVRIEVPTLPRGGRAWADALVELASQLDKGLVYDRDLRELAQALAVVLQALNRRPGHRAR